MVRDEYLLRPLLAAYRKTRSSRAVAYIRHIQHVLQFSICLLAPVKYFARRKRSGFSFVQNDDSQDVPLGWLRGVRHHHSPVTDHWRLLCRSRKPSAYDQRVSDGRQVTERHPGLHIYVRVFPVCHSNPGQLVRDPLLRGHIHVLCRGTVPRASPRSVLCSSHFLPTQTDQHQSGKERFMQSISFYLFTSLYLSMFVCLATMSCVFSTASTWPSVSSPVWC